SSPYYIFTQDLQALVNELAMEIPIPHYPPYTSKYNPYISPLCQGLIFESVQTVKDLMATATTRTGLKLLTTILYKTYQTSRNVAVDFKSNLKIVFDQFLPQWNYTPKPQLQVI
ncbi:ISAzo13-like element transposase-related protein, partial [Trichormus azollae]|uniref:ISAzo13-like element transposase-related protein n=1 Tax=Trichormus azollae TaxID=1164 RepID=UPI00325CDC22